MSIFDFFREFKNHKTSAHRVGVVRVISRKLVSKEKHRAVPSHRDGVTMLYVCRDRFPANHALETTLVQCERVAGLETNDEFHRFATDQQIAYGKCFLGAVVEDPNELNFEALRTKYTENTSKKLKFWRSSFIHYCKNPYNYAKELGGDDTVITMELCEAPSGLNYKKMKKQLTKRQQEQAEKERKKAERKKKEEELM